MRVQSLIWIALFALLALYATNADASSGGGCAGCTLAVSLIQQFATVHRLKISDAMNKFCGYMGAVSKEVAQICSLASLLIADKLQKDYDQKLAPEVTCATTFKMYVECPHI